MFTEVNQKTQIIGKMHMSITKILPD